MPGRFKFFAVFLSLLIALVVLPSSVWAQHASAEQQKASTRYLLFQIFTYCGPSGSVLFPSPGEIETTVRDITKKINTKGDIKNKLGICLGPLTLSHSDDEVRRLIANGFEIARKNDVAVAFHIDDQMFWDRRKDLHNKESVEWIDWKGTEGTGRRLDWSEKPAKIAPQLCLNSRTVQDAVKSRAKVIGEELKKQIDKLKSENKEYLYAGTIVGWESMIGRDYDTGKSNGYHALVNRGFSAARPPAQADRELSRILSDFIELWAKSVVEAGAPRSKTYSHIAFMTQGFDKPGANMLEAMGFANADTAFGKSFYPGFSLYPSEDTLEQILAPLHKHNDPPWIMAEGCNVVPDGLPGEATMETYLGKLFNHGAVAANIYSWGIGGEAERDKNMFRRATENGEAIAAYRKFLTGQKLVELPRSASALSPNRFRKKMETIQRELPGWISGKPERERKARSIMERVDRSIKSNNLKQADATADEMLELLKQ